MNRTIEFSPSLFDVFTMTDTTRQRLIAAAGPIFAEKGFDNATVREICDAAGTNIASVNYHFGDKETLYAETLKQAHACRFQQVPTPQWDAELPAREKLHRFVTAMLTRMLHTEEEPWQMRLMMQEMSRPTSGAHALVEAFIRPEFEVLLRIVGEFVPEETPAHQRRHIAFSVVGQCMFYKMGRNLVPLLVRDDTANRLLEVERLADHITNLTVSALTSETNWLRESSNPPP